MTQLFDLIVRRGSVVTPSGIVAADIGCRAGRITALGDLGAASADRVIDAVGLTVLPGVIDTQVHFREPGMEHKEDLATGTAAAALGGVMIWNEKLKRNIPDGWKVDKINTKIKIGSGYPFDSRDYDNNGIYKIITIKNVQEGQLETNKADRIASVPIKLQSFCRLALGDVLISLTGNVGRMCFVTENNLLLNQRVGKLIAENEYVNYGYLFFSRPENRKRIEKIAGGSSQSNLSPIDAVKDLMCFPDIERLKMFNKIIDPIFTMLINCNRENQTLSGFRDWLLPMLMNGQVKVS